jgi:hypothetical protein
MTGKNRIMIYGPKDDGAYVVDFRTADLSRFAPRTLRLVEHTTAIDSLFPGCGERVLHGSARGFRWQPMLALLLSLRGTGPSHHRAG